MSRPFKARHIGRCPYCEKRILEGQTIVRLDKRVSKLEMRHSKHGRYRSYQKFDYAHVECVPIPLEDH